MTTRAKVKAIHREQRAARARRRVIEREEYRRQGKDFAISIGNHNSAVMLSLMFAAMMGRKR